MNESTKINILLAISVLILIGVGYISFKVLNRTSYAYGMKNERFQMQERNNKQRKMYRGQTGGGMRHMNCPYMNQVQ